MRPAGDLLSEILILVGPGPKTSFSIVIIPRQFCVVQDILFEKYGCWVHAVVPSSSSATSVIFSIADSGNSIAVIPRTVLTKRVWSVYVPEWTLCHTTSIIASCIEDGGGSFSRPPPDPTQSLCLDK